MFVIGCSNRISPFFEYNTYGKDQGYKNVKNDSLKLYHNTFGDIQFAKKKKELRRDKTAKKYSLDNVLVRGEATMAPYYKYYILANSKKSSKHYRDSFFVHDTILKGNRLTFIGLQNKDELVLSDFNFLSSSIGLSSNKLKDSVDLWGILNDCVKTNRYLKCLSNLNSYKSKNNSEKSMKLQMQLTYSTFIKDRVLYDSLISRWEGQNKNKKIIDRINEMNINDLDDIVNLVSDQLHDNKLVMFNENHFYPNHRQLLTRILPLLKQKGYNYLALEALDGNDSAQKLNNNGELSFESGFYTREESFIQLIKEAKSLGFKFIAYDTIGGKVNREIQQAKNIYNRTFLKDPKAKVVVYGGIDHILEEKDAGGKYRMAYYFKEMFKIDPLTFSQTILAKYSKYVSESKEVLLLSKEEFKAVKEVNVDFLIVNNLKNQKQSYNFSYENTLEEDLQISFYKIKPQEENSLPLKNSLIKSKSIYYGELDENFHQFYSIYDKQGNAIKTEKVLFK